VTTFEEAVELRDQIIGLGWARDLIAVEAWGMDITNGSRPKGYRVVLAWANGRLKRIGSLDEAMTFLPASTTLGVASSEPRHALAVAVPTPTPVTSPQSP
jgi:hypothetical protein